MSDRLFVSEIFESVQGEGVSLGLPSVFLRLSHCNLRCTWCDTKYTWDWQHYDVRKEVHECSLSQVANAIRALQPRNLVVTGGEPLLQQAAVANLLPRLGSEWTTEVETAGTVSPTASLKAAITQWNVSPKLANSGNPLEKRLRTEAFEVFSSLSNAYFKFVIASSADLSEVSDLVTRFNIPPNRVMLMPEATHTEQLNVLSRTLVDLCIQRGYRLGYRLHVALWGQKRGV